MSTDRAERLYAALLQHAGKAVPLELLAEESGYAASSLRTYVSKNMLVP